MMFDFSRVLSTTAMGVALGAMGLTAASAAGPLGELEVRGQVRVGQQADDAVVTVSDTTYGWFSGDRIDTRSGHAVLSLDEGGSFGFGQKTAATLSSDGGRISVNLESGVMLYAIEGDATELAVASGDYSFTTRSGEAEPVAVAADAPVSSGMIEVLEDGEVRVSVHAGVMTASDSTGSLFYQVDTGDAVEFSGSEVRQVEVQVEAARGDEDDGGNRVVAWIQENPALTGLMVAAGAFGVYRVFFHDDDDDPEPVSP